MTGSGCYRGAGSLRLSCPTLKEWLMGFGDRRRASLRMHELHRVARSLLVRRPSILLEKRAEGRTCEEDMLVFATPECPIKSSATL